jgi:DNA polymerase III epsilon subunit-like protein
VLDLATLYQSWTLVAGEKLGGLSLRQAATTAGMLPEGGVAHRALDDARLTLECYRHYIGRLAAVDPPALSLPDSGDGDGANAED